MPPSSGWDDDAEEGAPSTRRISDSPHGPLGRTHGADPIDGSTRFRVWAPDRARVELVLFARDEKGPRELRRVPMVKDETGFHSTTVPGVGHGDLYAFSPDGEGPFPDPASRHQPFGVHGPSQVVDVRRFAFRDRAWRGCPIEDLIVWECHVGTATKEGTFRALIGKLEHVRSLGATAIELMPVADFPGDRNWGYDGVSLYAPARCYGTPEDLAALVDAAHARGLAVILDVVYNHFGPDGNYLRAYSKRYFTDRHKTPWGDAINYDGEGAEPVRALVTENAASWIRDYHFDGLRLDATHAILDDRQPHLLAAIADAARAAASEREVLIIAEDERNEARVVREVSRGGHGLDGVWADDFHHEVRRIVAGDDEAWFADFAGDLDELVTLLRKGWLYEGQATKSGHARGTPAFDIAPPHFVYCIQNHDQVGNRATGDRLHHGMDLARYRAAVALLLSTPFTPMLFMGQEFAASAPFAFFTDHKPDLGKLITEGRRGEFAKFKAFADPETRAAIPDPQAASTFETSKLDWTEAQKPPGSQVLALHRDLLSLRRTEPAMAAHARADYAVARIAPTLVAVRRQAREGDALLFVVGLREGGSVTLGETAETDAGERRKWAIELDTENARYGGCKPATLANGVLTLNAPGAVVLRAKR